MKTLYPQFPEIALILKFCSQQYYSNIEIQTLSLSLSLTLWPIIQLLTNCSDFWLRICGHGRNVCVCACSCVHPLCSLFSL